MSSPRDDTADETADDTAFYKENVPVFSITQNIKNNSCNAIIKPSFREELEQKTLIHCVNENVSVATTNMLMHTSRMVESLAKRNVMHNRVQSGAVPLMSRVENLEAENATLKFEVSTLKTEMKALKAENAAQIENLTRRLDAL